MFTTCIIIVAWASNMPLWASITTTILAGIRFTLKLGTTIAKTMKEFNEDFK